MGPVASKGRKPNTVYRVREHLTEQEIGKLLTALKANRHGQRDWLIGFLIYRHGLRVSEACDIRWDDIDLPKRTIAIRRLKGSQDSTHFLERDEVTGLKALQRLYEAQPFNRMGIARMVERAGKAAKLPFPVHVHMLRHSTGYALANRRHGYAAVAALPRARFDHEHDPLHRDVTRAIQRYLALITRRAPKVEAEVEKGPTR